MTDTTNLRAGLCCSFCRKGPDEVAKLVAGPGVYICNECVDLSAEIIRNSAPASPQASGESAVEAWEQRLSDEELLAHLPRVAAASAQVEQHLTGWVRQARSRGLTWTRIGEALGMTRQSAWERFSGED
jgi:hypothetical protein